MTASLLRRVGNNGSTGSGYRSGTRRRHGGGDGVQVGSGGGPNETGVCTQPPFVGRIEDAEDSGAAGGSKYWTASSATADLGMRSSEHPPGAERTSGGGGGMGGRPDGRGSAGGVLGGWRRCRRLRCNIGRRGHEV